MRLREFLRSDFVVLRLEANDIDGVVGEVCACAAAAGIGDAEVIADKLLERERAHSTVIGSGLAIPHATVPGLAEPVIGVAIAGTAGGEDDHGQAEGRKSSGKGHINSIGFVIVTTGRVLQQGHRNVYTGTSRRCRVVALGCEVQPPLRDIHLAGESYAFPTR